MATSRTGTGKYRGARAVVVAEAKARGLTNCPGCNVVLDYDLPLQPNSAETDHVVPFAKGGSDDADNLRVLCRACNVERNRKVSEYTNHGPGMFPNSRQW